MLVLLENGEQRLITFTLPKEACTIQEILEQVNVPFRTDTDIQVTEANTNGINYIVTVGNVPCFGYEASRTSFSLRYSCNGNFKFNFQEEETQMQEESPLISQPPPLVPQPTAPQPTVPQPQTEPQQLPPCSTSNAQLPPEPPKASTPEPPKEVPKYVPGMLALCAGCGYLSEDFSKCIRCGRKLPDNVKAIPATIRSSNGQKKDMSSVQQQSKTIPSTYPIYYTCALSVIVSFLVTLKPQSPSKKKSARSKVIEHESVVISSDEEEDDKPSKMVSK